MLYSLYMLCSCLFLCEIAWEQVPWSHVCDTTAPFFPTCPCLFRGFSRRRAIIDNTPWHSLRCRASAFHTPAHRGSRLDHTRRHFDGRSRPWPSFSFSRATPKLPIPLFLFHSCRRPHYSALMACPLLHDWTFRYRQPRSVVISPLVLNSLMAISHLFLHLWERKQFLHLWLYISQTMCTMLLSAWIGFALLLNIDPCYVRISFISRLTSIRLV